LQRPPSIYWLCTLQSVYFTSFRTVSDDQLAYCYSIEVTVTSVGFERMRWRRLDCAGSCAGPSSCADSWQWTTLCQCRQHRPAKSDRYLDHICWTASDRFVCNNAPEHCQFMFILSSRHHRGYHVIVRPLSTVEYTTNLIYDCCSCTLFTLSSASPSVSGLLTLGSEVGCDHSSVNKPGANGRMSYDSLTHYRLYCRDREKK